MKRLLLVLLFFLLLTPTASKAQQCESLGSFTWMLGDWVAEGAKFQTHESWKQVSPQTYEGIGKIVSKDTGEERSEESIRLVEMSDEIFYLPKAEHNALPIAFKLTECTGDKAVFENRAHDFPKMLRYQQVANDSLHVYVGDGRREGFVLKFARSK